MATSRALETERKEITERILKSHGILINPQNWSTRQLKEIEKIIFMAESTLKNT